LRYKILVTEAPLVTSDILRPYANHSVDRVASSEELAVNKERLIAALELGYYGGDLWSSIMLIFGEFGFMAQEDPDAFIASLRILERRAQQLLPPEDAVPILDSLQHIRNGCLRRKRAESDWIPLSCMRSASHLVFRPRHRWFL
jgi:hypothetical protein